MPWKLHPLKYNNYYNRQLKRFNELRDYLQYEIADIPNNINFNVKNGLQNTVVINDWTYDMPDYCIVENLEDLSFTRWFVMESTLITGNQYRLTLKRDLLAENIVTVLNSECLVEKASNANELVDFPDVWNKEDLTTNEIKVSETQFADAKADPWLVIYTAKNLEKRSFTFDLNLYEDYNFNSLSDLTNKWTFVGSNQYFIDDTLFSIYYKTGNQYRRFVFNCNGYFKTDIVSNVDSKTITLVAPKAYYECDYYSITGSLIERLNQIYNNKASQYDKLNTMTDLNGKVAKTTDDNKYYSLNLSKTGTTYLEFSESDYSLLYDIAKQLGLTYTEESDDNFSINQQNDIYLMSADEIAQDTITVQLPTQHTNNSLFDVYCMKFGYDSVNIVQDTNRSCKYVSLAIANAIIENIGSNAIYDIQLLPFVPDELNHSSVSINSDGSIGYCRIYSIPSVRFSKTFTDFDINTCQNAKVANQCEFIRIVSPNFNGQFEFTTIGNGSLFLDKFNIDVELKPYQPYIHINPEFGGLYGNDYNDARGLICSGDFSLSQIGSAWSNYQLNNKNYENVFNRQIENMQTKQGWQRAENIVGTIAGTVSGAISGGIGGSLVGNATAGALAGGISSAVGGTMDIIESEALYRENLDYTKDMYNYNLQNIQAQPYSLSKVSSMNNNNKIFPIIERYTCTYTEQQMLYNKIKYNGCTINRIAKIADFMTESESYFKGRIIRVNNLNDDFHVATALAYEVNKGFFTCSDYYQID